MAERDMAIAITSSVSRAPDIAPDRHVLVARPRLVTRTLALAVLDAVVTIAALLLCLALFHRPDGLRDPAVLTVTICLTPAMSLSFMERGLYSRSEVSTRHPNWRKIALAWVQAVAVGALLIFCLAPAADSLSLMIPRGLAAALRGPWLPSLLLTGGIALIGSRFAYAHSRVTRAPVNRAVIIGEPTSMHDLLQRIGSDHNGGFHVLGIFRHEDDPPDDARRSFLGLPMLGGLRALERMIRRNEVDTVLVAVPWSAGERVRQIIRHLSMAPVDVYIYPGMNELDLPAGRPAAAFELPLLMASARPIDGWRAFIKRAEDLLLTSLILLLISPAMLVIAVLVKATSSGPVFFRQRRVGYNNQLIEVLKFRSMYTHLSDADASQQTKRGDNRITPVGVWLRKFSLDELPQLFNVLLGDMSLVGPRPHALATTAGGVALEEAVPDYASRHRVKPGITGWAQVCGYRGALDNVEKIVHRVNHDLYYIENWSLTLDLKILCLTATRIFADDNAF